MSEIIIKGKESIKEIKFEIKLILKNKFMKASTKRMLSILLAILFLIGAVFIYSYLIKPAYGEVLNLRTKN